jgi:hypothetical protein
VPAIGFDELAGVFLGRAGERTLLVAEQDAFDEIVGDGAAIDRHERLFADARRSLNGAGEDLLADAGLAFDEHRDVRRRRLLAEPMTRSMAGLRVMRSLNVRARRSAARHARRVSPSSSSTFSALAIAVCSRSGEAGLTTKSTAPARMAVTDRIDAALRGLDDDRRLDRAFAESFQHVEAIDAGHDQIEDHHMDVAAAFEPVERGLAAVHRRRLMAEPAHGRFQQATLDGVVVDDEDIGPPCSERLIASRNVMVHRNGTGS